MKLKEIHRTSTFAWSPTPSLPLLATGTAAGALDASFSNESQLEIWAPDFLDKEEYDLGVEGQHGAKGFINDGSRSLIGAPNLGSRLSTASCLQISSTSVGERGIEPPARRHRRWHGER
jgi:hypothetical protein